MKSTFTKSIGLFLALQFFAASSQATNYYLSAEQISIYGADLKLSESLSFNTGASAGYFWYTLGEDGTTKNWCTQLPDFTDASSTFNFVYATGEASGNVKYNIDVDVAFNGILRNWGKNDSYGITVSSPDFSAKEIQSCSYNAKFLGANTVVNVGDITKGKWNDPINFGCVDSNVGTIKSLNVTGTFNVIASNSYYNSLYVSNGNSSVDNPDVVINTLKGYSGGAFAMLSYGINQGHSFSSFALDLVSNWQFGAMKTNSGVLAAGSLASKGHLTLILATNQADATTSGAIWQGDYTHSSGIYSLRNGGVVVDLVMKAEKDSDGNYYTQSFTGDKIAFTGGVQMISGNLKINYGVDSAYKYSNYGKLTLSQAAGEKTSFGNSGAVGGTFAFSEIIVEGGGTIIAKCEGTASAGDFKIDTISLTDGGINHAEGASGKIAIDFAQTEEYLSELIREQSDKSAWVKVISWTDGNTSQVDVVGTQSSIMKDGVQYAFSSFNADDGLYVAYVAVPEPSTVAAIFGALALAFAAWRRRK